MNSLICFIMLLVSLGILTFTSIKHLVIQRIIFKTLTSLLFCIQAPVSRKECSSQKASTYYKLIFAGLFFSMIGDVAMALDNNRSSIFLVIGIIGFACAHISYIIGFFQHEKLSLLNIVWFAAFFAVIFLVLSHDTWFEFGNMKPIIIGYGILISFMVAKSLSLWKYRRENAYFVYLTIAATSLFLISDTVLLFYIFGKTSSTSLQIINNFIYYIGQGLFGLSFRKELLVKADHY